VLAVLGGLRARGVKLALVTNSFAEDVAGWEESPLRAYFDVVVFSCVVGLAKPDPNIYLLACQELHVLPACALFIGDGGDDEIAGALAAGLSACRALWHVPRWERAAVARDAPGLWHPADVLHAALGA